MVTSCGLRSTMKRSMANRTIRPAIVANHSHTGTDTTQPPVHRAHANDRRSPPPISTTDRRHREPHARLRADDTAAREYSPPRLHSVTHECGPAPAEVIRGTRPGP